MSKTTIFNLIKILYTLVTILVLSLIAGFVFSWTSPSAIPPNDNVDAPLNTGSSGQTKEGGLILNTGGANNGLTVNGTSTFMGPISIGVDNTGTAGQVLQSGGPGNPPEWANGVGGGSWSFIEQKTGDAPCYECSPATSVDIPDRTKYIIGYLGAYTSFPGVNGQCRMQGPITIVLGSKDMAIVKEAFNNDRTPEATGSVQAVVNGSNLDLTTSISGTGGSTGHLTYELYFYEDSGSGGNNVVTLTAGETINGATVPVPVFIENGEFLSEIKIPQTSGNIGHTPYGSLWKGQTFTTDATTNRISQIDLYLIRTNFPSGNFTVSIYATSGGLPTGLPLGTKTMLAMDIGYSLYEWYPFLFEDVISVTPNTQYAIVFNSVNGNSSNFIMARGMNSNIYGGGTYVESDNSGGSWQSRIDSEITFNIYGYTDTGSIGQVFKSSAGDITKLKYTGFAISNATLNDSAEIQTSGVVDGFTGLTIGKNYYIQNIAGTIGKLKGINEILVGIAVSTTELLIQNKYSF